MSESVKNVVEISREKKFLNNKKSTKDIDFYLIQDLKILMLRYFNEASYIYNNTTEKKFSYVRIKVINSLYC